MYLASKLTKVVHTLIRNDDRQGRIARSGRRDIAAACLCSDLGEWGPPLACSQ
jgi:hypothetical protein